MMSEIQSFLVFMCLINRGIRFFSDGIRIYSKQQLLHYIRLIQFW